MNEYRSIYNKLLDLKFRLLDIFDSEGREVFKDELSIITDTLQSLDELATPYQTLPYREFITGNKSNGTD